MLVKAGPEVVGASYYCRSAALSAPPHGNCHRARCPAGTLGYRDARVVHRSGRAVADGQPVRVVRPGWVLDEDDGRFVVLPAEVE